MALACQSGQNYLTEEEENIGERMVKFNTEIKKNIFNGVYSRIGSVPSVR